MIPLPIDSLLPHIQSSLQANSNLIIQAAPGAGKTTRVPVALLAPEISEGGEVWVLEPRRIAARLSARRVAEELQEKLGESVGYQIRFEDIGGPRTRLRFITEGVLTRRLMSNPTLNGIAAIIFDEFHERHLQTDVGLALMRRLQNTHRPDLKIVVMSATLETTKLAKYLGDCPILSSEGQQFAVAVSYLKEHDARPLEEQVVFSIKRALAIEKTGDLLVFLPGAAEIRKTQAACADVIAQANLLVLPLHGELSSSEQDVAIRPSSRRKVILSTNVAETSITIDGITVVIDSGLARIAEQSSWSGLPSLNIKRISQASAMQRAGRAGRTRAGICLRLFTEMDFASRPMYELPELQRLDLTTTLLELKNLGITEAGQFNWFDAPSDQAIERAQSLLKYLGATNSDGELTVLGKRMSQLPLHPRQARIFLEAEKRGIPNRGALFAALINERDLRVKSLTSLTPKQLAEQRYSSDLFLQEELFESAQRVNFDPIRLHQQGINAQAAFAVKRTVRQILQIKHRQNTEKDSSEEASDEAILLAILTGYSDQVARVQESDNKLRGHVSYFLMNGLSAQLSHASTVKGATFLVALDTIEKDRQRGRAVEIHRASSIKADWLLDLFPELLTEQNRISWNDYKEAVEVVSQLCYGQIVLAESPIQTNQLNWNEQQKVTQILINAVQKRGWQHLLDPLETKRFLNRIIFVNKHFPSLSLPQIDEEILLDLLIAKCAGRSSFAELQSSLQGDSLSAKFLSQEHRLFLDRMAPERINIAGRKNIRINYEPNKAPWIESRLQDFFGMKTTPNIGQGAVPLVIHLLAPNQRAVQVTMDLAGFWKNLYPQVRRELCRRYPKHAWPEDPLLFQKQER